MLPTASARLRMMKALRGHVRLRIGAPMAAGGFFSSRYSWPISVQALRQRLSSFRARWKYSTLCTHISHMRGCLRGLAACIAGHGGPC